MRGADLWQQAYLDLNVIESTLDFGELLPSELTHKLLRAFKAPSITRGPLIMLDIYISTIGPITRSS